MYNLHMDLEYSFEEVEVIIENRHAGIELGGTLTLPSAEHKVPAVLLLQGSGTHDRDETVLGHKPFLVLAHHLSRKGISVLRVDNRGVGKSTGDSAAMTMKDYVEDALSCIEYLRSREEINSSRIGLIGHSEGGVVATEAAIRAETVSFIIMLAPPGLVGEDLLYVQAESIGRAEGLQEEDIKRNRSLQESLFAVLKRTDDPKKAEEQLKNILKSSLPRMPENEEERKIQEAQQLSQLRLLLSPWFREFLSYDPAVSLEKIRCPVLVIFGSKDLQAPPQNNVQAISDALKKGTADKYDIVTIPELNHLFQTAVTGSPSEYLTSGEPMSKEVIYTIISWLADIS